MRQVKLTDIDTVYDISDDDKFIVQTDSGTKIGTKEKLLDAIKNSDTFINAVSSSSENTNSETTEDEDSADEDDDSIEFNTTYRGNNLTSLYGPDGTGEYDGKTGLEALSAKLQAGDVSDLYIGDYVTVPIEYYIPTYSGSSSSGYTVSFDSSETKSINWVIAAFDYYRNKGNFIPITQNGIVNPHTIMLIPKSYIYEAKMNLTYTAEGGYAGTHMYSTILGSRNQGSTYSFLTYSVINAFGENHVLSHSRLLTNSVNTNAVSMGCDIVEGNEYPDPGSGSGASNSFAWYPVELCLLNEKQVFGELIFDFEAECPNWSSSCFDIGDGYEQIPLFNLNSSSKVVDGSRWWLSSVASSNNFCCVYTSGSALNSGARNSLGVRPYFLFA